VIVGIIRRKPVLTYASIIFGNMLASVNSVNSVNTNRHSQNGFLFSFANLPSVFPLLLSSIRLSWNWISDSFGKTLDNASINGVTRNSFGEGGINLTSYILAGHSL